MTTKIIFSVIVGVLLLGICVWSYHMSNVDNTSDGKEAEAKEEGDGR